MNYKLHELINKKDLNKLLSRISDALGIQVILIDNNKKILSFSNSDCMKIFFKFYQKNKAFFKKCNKSIKNIIKNLDNSEFGFQTNECFQAMTYCVISIGPKDNILGFILIGQFFLKKPDLDFYKRLAKKNKIDVRSYLKLISKVPVITKKQMNKNLTFIKEIFETAIKKELYKIKKNEIEKDLFETNIFSESIINSLPGIFYVLNQKSSFVLWNKNLENATGLTKKELIGKDCLTTIHEYDKEFVRRKLSEVIENGHSIFETRIINKNKEIKYFILTGQKIILDNKIYIVGSGIDITEKRRSEEVLKEKKEIEKELHQFFDITLDLLCIADTNGNFRHMNIAWEKTTGFTVKELTSKKFYDFIHPDDIQATMESLAILESQKELINFVNRFKCKDGTYRNLEWRSAPAGKLFYAAARDITSHLQSEKILQESEERFRKIFEGSPIGMALSDKSYRFVQVNESFCKMLGYTKEEILNLTFKDITHPEHLNNDIKQITKLSTGEIDIYKTEKRYFKKNKEIIWAQISITALHGNKGEVNYFIAMVEDITERKVMEETIKEKDEIFRLFLEYSPIYVFFKDKNIRALQLSKNYEKMLGMPLEKMLGKTMDELFPSSLAKKMIEDDKKVLLEGKPVEVIEELNNRTYSTIKFPITQKNKPDLLAGFTIDITEKIEKEKALKESEERFRMLVENAPDAIYVQTKGNFAYLNKTALKLFGVESENILLGKPILDRIHPDFLSISKERIKKINEERKINPVLEQKYLKIDGTEINAEASAVPIIYNNENGALVFLRDISERKKKEKELIESENLCHSLIETTDTGYVVIDNEGKVINANQEYVRLTGRQNLKEILGKSVIEWTASYEKEKNEKAILKCIKDGFIRNLEIDYIDKNGKITPIEINATVVELDGNNKIITLCRDITERKKAIKDMQKNEIILRSIFEAIPIGVGLIKSRVIQKVNNAICRITGYSEKELIGQNTLMLYPDEKEYSRIGKNLYHRLAYEGFGLLEGNFKKKDGKIIDVILTLAPFNTKALEEGYTLTVIDISERKKAEEALLESEERFRKIFEEGEIGIALESSDFSFIKVNKAFSSMVGYSAKELYSKSFNKITHPDDVVENSRAAIALWKEEMPYYKTEKRYIHKNGKIVWVFIAVSLIKNKQGEPIYYLTMIQDITERKKIEEELKKFNEELETRIQNRTAELIAANKELEAFSYSISHDLRAPLRSISGFSQILLDDFKEKLDEKERDYLNRVINASNQLSQLIDDLLKLSHISREEIHKTKVDLSRLANEIFSEIKNIGPERNVEFICQPDIIALADKILIKSVINNLLQNSWKYTSKHSNAKIEFGETIQSGRTIYFIKDDGAGFDMKYADKIFQPFQRLHSPKDFEGTGIGLATAKRIINKHGGKIWIDSEVEKGTTVFFTIE